MKKQKIKKVKNFKRGKMKKQVKRKISKKFLNYEIEKEVGENENK